MLYVIQEIFKGRATENLKYDTNVQELFVKTSPKYFITTLEGSSHEKIFFKKYKKINKTCKTFGYQHSFLLKSQNSLLNNNMTSTYPDFIFTSSNTNYKFLKKKKIFKKIKFFNIGKIHRTRTNYNINFLNKENICLLAPEGILKETIKMIDFLKDLNFKTKIIFLLRLHPDLFKKREFIMNYINKIKNTNVRITVSENNLEKDIKKAKFGIYSGSSMVFTFMENYVYPIFLETSKSESEINPIQMIKKINYKKVSNPIHLNKIFKIKIKKHN